MDIFLFLLRFRVTVEGFYLSYAQKCPLIALMADSRIVSTFWRIFEFIELMDMLFVTLSIRPLSIFSAKNNNFMMPHTNNRAFICSFGNRCGRNILLEGHYVETRRVKMVCWNQGAAFGTESPPSNQTLLASV